MVPISRQQPNRAHNNNPQSQPSNHQYVQQLSIPIFSKTMPHVSPTDGLPLPFEGDQTTKSAVSTDCGSSIFTSSPTTTHSGVSVTPAATNTSARSFPATPRGNTLFSLAARNSCMSPVARNSCMSPSTAMTPMSPSNGAHACLSFSLRNTMNEMACNLEHIRQPGSTAGDQREGGGKGDVSVKSRVTFEKSEEQPKQPWRMQYELGLASPFEI